MQNWTRYALLAVIAAQPMAAIAQLADPAIESEKPSQVVLEADNINVDEATNTVIAEGNVEAVYEGRILRADRLVYNRDTDRVRATGNIVILDPDGTQRFAEEIETDNSLTDGYAINFSTRMPNGGVATAESAARQEDGSNSLEKIVYTSCEMCEGDKRPTWALRARRAVLNQETEMISYRDAVLEVGGIPVVYLPYFAHPDPQSERRSGFLAPDFGTSSKLGLFYQQPYYWAISPSQDLTVAPQVMANVNPFLEIEYRKKFWSGQLSTNFSFTDEQDFDSDGEKFGEKKLRGHFFADGEFNITNNWEWGFGIEQASDDLYTRRYDITGADGERGLYQSQPLRFLTQVHTIGQDKNWYADASVLSFNGLRASDDDDRFAKALPISFAERLFDFGNYGLVGVNASTAILSREVGVDSHRASLGTDWSTQRILPGGLLLNPFAEARYDYYEIDRDTGLPSESVDRGVATAGARLSYPLYRPGKSVDILVEPIAMAAVATKDANADNVPVEDSLFYEADETTLFDANPLSGYDLYEGGSKAAIGVSTTARWKNGVEVSALAGRRWREEEDAAFGVASNLDGTASDWVASINADFGNPLQVETRLRLDDSDFSISRIDARVRTRWNRLQGSARYYRLNGNITENGAVSEGVELQSQLKVTDQYYFVYSLRRDIAGTLRGGIRTPGRDIDQSIGVAYEDDCSRFEISFTRSEAVDRTLGPNDSIQFRFSLKTLGSFGDDELD